MGKFSISSRKFFTLQEENHPKSNAEHSFFLLAIQCTLLISDIVQYARQQMKVEGFFSKGERFQRRKILTTCIL